MWRQGQNLLRRASLRRLELHPHPHTTNIRHVITGAASSPSLSIWRRKKEMGKEGLMVAKELKRLQCHPLRFERFMKTHVSRLLKSDLVAVLVEFQRQNLVSLSMKVIPAFLDSGLPDEAMRIYDEMRCSPDPPLSLPFRVILKGLIPYPELREKVKDDFLELFPGMIIYDPPEDLFDDDQQWRIESEED
ncbi:hypothetical protein DH2020_027987 [Rehmannia glutinosa]|uniref:Pentatricopeptide repeat-containing protein n=1 Tax=Rehmannia glutinosa TaxID=99300 RepID=A0ABR0VVN7_REHGL